MNPRKEETRFQKMKDFFCTLSPCCIKSRLRQGQSLENVPLKTKEKNKKLKDNRTSEFLKKIKSSTSISKFEDNTNAGRKRRKLLEIEKYPREEKDSGQEVQEVEDEKGNKYRLENKNRQIRVKGKQGEKLEKKEGEEDIKKGVENRVETERNDKEKERTNRKEEKDIRRKKRNIEKEGESIEIEERNIGRRGKDIWEGGSEEQSEEGVNISKRKIWTRGEEEKKKRRRLEKGSTWREESETQRNIDREDIREAERINSRGRSRIERSEKETENDDTIEIEDRRNRDKFERKGAIKKRNHQGNSRVVAKRDQARCEEEEFLRKMERQRRRGENNLRMRQNEGFDEEGEIRKLRTEDDTENEESERNSLEDEKKISYRMRYEKDSNEDENVRRKRVDRKGSNEFLPFEEDIKVGKEARTKHKESASFGKSCTTVEFLCSDQQRYPVVTKCPVFREEIIKACETPLKNQAHNKIDYELPSTSRGNSNTPVDHKKSVRGVCLGPCPQYPDVDLRSWRKFAKKYCKTKKGEVRKSQRKPGNGKKESDPIHKKKHKGVWKKFKSKLSSLTRKSDKLKKHSRCQSESDRERNIRCNVKYCPSKECKEKHLFRKQCQNNKDKVYFHKNKGSVQHSRKDHQVSASESKPQLVSITVCRTKQMNKKMSEEYNSPDEFSNATSK